MGLGGTGDLSSAQRVFIPYLRVMIRELPYPKGDICEFNGQKLDKIQRSATGVWSNGFFHGLGSQKFKVKVLVWP